MREFRVKVYGFKKNLMEVDQKIELNSYKYMQPKVMQI